MNLKQTGVGVIALVLLFFVALAGAQDCECVDGIDDDTIDDIRIAQQDVTECDDDIDNDRDGLIDWDGKGPGGKVTLPDPGCHGLPGFRDESSDNQPAPKAEEDEPA